MSGARIVLPRRRLLRGAVAVGGLGLLAGCDALSRSPGFVDVLATAEPVNRRVQRWLTGERLAPEYPRSMISPVFKPNGSINPQTPEYLALRADNFADFRLRVSGLVERALELSLTDIHALPTRTQVTRHDCVEGWSVIGEWSGVQLSTLLGMARVRPAARHVVFHCFDDLLDDGTRYYESIDLLDAHHPQTLVAHTMNGAPVPVANGAPLRMRIERKLGYKQAKYVHTIELVDGYARLAGGKGGTWEDNGYDWYGGI